MREALLALLLLSAQRDPVPSRRPVAITGPAVMESEHKGLLELQYDLINRSPHAITGWGFRYEITMADGKKRSGGIGLLGPLEETGREPLQVPAGVTARQSQVVHPVSTSPVVEVSVSLTWVIFADRSSFGDAREIDAAFASRERRYQEEVFVVEKLRAAQREASGIDALRAALRSLDGAGTPESRTHVRGNLQRGIDGKVPLSPDAYLLALIEMHEKNRDRLAPHLRPR